MYIPIAILLNYVMNRMLLNFTLSAILSLLLIACAPRLSGTTIAELDTSSLESLQSLYDQSKPNDKLAGRNRMRETALKEVALGLGAQAGLAERAKHIDEELTKQARILDTVFDFNNLIINQNVLPPVLLEGRNSLNLADTQTIRVSNRTYRILKQSRFVTSPPTW